MASNLQASSEAPSQEMLHTQQRKATAGIMALACNASVGEAEDCEFKVSLS